MDLLGHWHELEIFEIDRDFVYLAHPAGTTEEIEKTVKNKLTMEPEIVLETRPILSGNFLNQPSVKLYKLDQNKAKFKNAQDIEERGFFIGLHTKKISKIEIEKIIENLLDIDKYL